MNSDSKKEILTNKVENSENQSSKELVFEETVCHPDFAEGCIDPDKSVVENSDNSQRNSN